MSSLPSISHRLFAAAVGRPQKAPGKGARRERAAEGADLSRPNGLICPPGGTPELQPGTCMEPWLQPRANSGI